ncbi:MAG TPA: hypothetical protein VFI42_03190 [Thermomicrobiaceae bacterium]|nr:hypothetical protein [Thermomicrobiaceae bacterium]
MQFLTIYTPAQQGQPDEAQMAEMGTFVEEMYRAGVVLATGGLVPSARARIANGEISIKQEPQSGQDTKGFALLQVDSQEQLDDLIRRFLAIAGDGESEIFRVTGPED